MANYSKWIAGALGWAFVGPIGALIGFAIGSLLDSADTRKQLTDPNTGQTYSPDGFTAALLVLTAAVMKADGRVLKAELEYVKTFFKNQFGADKASKDLLVLREILKKDFSLHQVAVQIQSSTDHPTRIALADGELDEAENRILKTIAGYLHINAHDLDSIKAMFGSHSLKDSYSMLEIEENATDEEVKKAFRRMATKFHPDKVSALGEAHVKAAEEKFKNIQEAFEKIKKARGI